MPSATAYYAYDGTNYYYVDATGGTGYEVYYKIVEVGSITLADGNYFEFEGIDDGTYVLVETQVPSGYNQADDVVFTVTAEHSASSITSLTTDQTGTITATAASGSLATTVVNNSGAVIPETGGMGTKIFYTLGGILVVCAGVLLIVKRRMRNA